MNLENFKFRVKPLEILILIVAIVVISFASILIKNYIKGKELKDMSIAENTTIEEGDTVIIIDDEPPETVEEKEEKEESQNTSSTPSTNAEPIIADTNNYNKTQKIVIKDGSTGVVEIPAINVLAQITEGSDSETLRNYVGVIEGSSRPGQTGNYALAAHNNIETEIFRDLHKLVEGDLVNIYTQSKMYTYKIVSKYTVAPTQIEVLDKPENKKEITLITCNYNATARVIVKGELISQKRVNLSKI